MECRWRLLTFEVAPENKIPTQRSIKELSWNFTLEWNVTQSWSADRSSDFVTESAQGSISRWALWRPSHPFNFKKLKYIMCIEQLPRADGCQLVTRCFLSVQAATSPVEPPPPKTPLFGQINTTVSAPPLYWRCTLCSVECDKDGVWYRKETLYKIF